MKSLFLFVGVLLSSTAYAQSPIAGGAPAPAPKAPQTVNIISISDLNSNGTELLYVINAQVVEYGTKDKSCNFKAGKTTYNIKDGALELDHNSKC